MKTKVVTEKKNGRLKIIATKKKKSTNQKIMDTFVKVIEKIKRK